MKTILTKIKHKGILFENIQGFVSTRHYILPYIISKDKILENQLKIFNGILKHNNLSSNFINNLFTFISDRILFRIVNEEKDLFDNNLYIPEEEEGENNKYQIIKKRILNIYRKDKYNKEKNININILQKYLPNDKEFALFLFDYLENKKQVLLLFPTFPVLKNDGDNYNKFISFYENNKILFETKEKINLISDNDTEIIYNKMNRKAVINIAFIGDKNSGKSTTIGHLLLSTGFIEHNDFIKTKKIADDSGLSTYKYSWLMDNLWEERNYRKTIVYHIKQLKTNKYDFNLIDLPGDLRLRKCIMKGLSLAEAAVIIITAENENSENNDYIKDYLIIAYTMGIRQLIIAINKMDQTKDIKYNEKNFLIIKKNMINLCKNVGYNIDNIQFIAYSGYTGQNLVNRHEDEDILQINKMNWYKGKALLESFDELKPPKRNINGPLKISIIDKYKISGIGLVFVGKILSGILKYGMNLILLMTKKIEYVCCKSIEIHCNHINEGIPGDIIGFNCKPIMFRDILYDKIFFVSDENTIKNAKIAENLRVKILMIKKKATIKVGSNFHLFSYTLNAPIRVVKIEYAIDDINKILEKEPKIIKNGYAIIIINFSKKFKPYSESKYKEVITGKYYFEKYSENPSLGSFELFNNNELIAVGNIKDINVL